MSETIDEGSKKKLEIFFGSIIEGLSKSYTLKVFALVKHIPDICRLHNLSLDNRKTRSEHPSKHHPVRPLRGEVFNALIHESVGSELCGNHLVVVVSNNKGNLFGEKVNVLPIEGDGTKINPKYHVQLSTSDLESGHLDKNPSRIIMTDIMTIDKARLNIKVGKINSEKMKEINKSLLKILSL